MNVFIDELGDLADPKHFVNTINLNGSSTDWGVSAYRDMVLIRKAEEAIADLQTNGETKTPIHLGIGQEAVAVGLSSHLNNKDKIYSGHRGHPHYLALHGSLDKLMAEILGRSTGASSGMGGSMHLYGPEVGFHGSVPIVGATIPIAVGAALASFMDQENSVSVCYFGDGACEEGILHESLNFARVMNLPVIFVCENNLFSSHLDIQLRQPSNRVSRFADAHHIPAETIDGNDVVATADLAGRMISAARNGMGPSFIEAVTYRWRGHVGANSDVDVGLRRSAVELKLWKKRDPIDRLAKALVKERNVSSEVFDEIDRQVDIEIAKAIAFAQGSPEAKISTILEFVYHGETDIG